ncbi:MAG: CHAT domain-containing protein, partial [Gemmatimonadota bacterium]|nr:CHAT domain-containing protein [Gemmatimonadota bacterium]
LGRRVRGEGVIGLSHAFLAAGGRATLVTLWRIADRSASEFMQDFYKELHAGLPLAEALLVVRRRWVAAGGTQAHPSHWAPFVLVGGVERSERQSSPLTRH